MRPVLLKYGGRGVAVAIESIYSPGLDTIFWSPKKPTGGGFNSYVCVENPAGQFKTDTGIRCDMVSINGIGEIRWKALWLYSTPTDEEILAIRHFKLSMVD